jgi:ATP-dependent DNA ligase
VFLYAFDLLELNGDHPRREPFEIRKATLASVLADAGTSSFNRSSALTWTWQHL